MSEMNRARLAQLLREAEGYLELGLAEHALATLSRVEHAGTFRGQVNYLRGEALRSLERYEEAVEPLETAAELSPSNVHVSLALGWCLKRIGRLGRAIEVLELALQNEAGDDERALVTYNLACYLSLAGQKDRALAQLAKAFALNDRYKMLAHSESDFDPIRSDPEFQSLASIIV